MKIIVCIKQVPNSQLIKIDPERGTLIREGVPSIINPVDKNALEEALRIRDRFPGSSTTVISMGPPQAASALREAMALGIDEAILLSDPAFAGSDTQATALVLASAIRKIAAYDIVICGLQAIDGDTAQVGPQLAEYLHLPQITYATKIDIVGTEVIVQRRYEDGHFAMRSPMPVLLTVVKELNTVRYPSIPGIRSAFKRGITFWNISDLVIDKNVVGLDGSPTKVLRSFVPQHNKKVEFLNGSSQDAAGSLIHKLQEKHVISI